MKDVRRPVAGSRTLQRIIAAIADITPTTVQKWAMGVGVTQRIEVKILTAIGEGAHIRGATGTLGEFAELDRAWLKARLEKLQPEIAKS